MIAMWCSSAGGLRDRARWLRTIASRPVPLAIGCYPRRGRDAQSIYPPPRGPQLQLPRRASRVSRICAGCSRSGRRAEDMRVTADEWRP